VDPLDELIYKPKKKPWVNNAPFVADGTFIGYIGDVYCMIAGAEHDADKHAEFTRHLQAALTGAPWDLQFGSILHLNHGPWWNGLSLGDKTIVLKNYAEILRRGEEKLNKTIPASANVLPSFVARAAARTVNTFVRPINPLAVVDNAQDGFRFIARTMPTVAKNLDRWLQAYRRAVEKHAPDLLPSVMKK
jgi:hypothetical protein